MRVTQKPTSFGRKSDKRARKFEDECVEFFGEVVQVLGIPPSVGQIYGLLFSSSRSLSFTDIVDRLEMSKGSVSQGLHLLRSLRALKRVAANGDRRELFEPELGLRRLVGGLLREKVEPLMQDAGERMTRLGAHVEEIEAPADRKFSAARVRQLETWRRQLALLLPLLKTILGSDNV